MKPTPDGWNSQPAATAPKINDGGPAFPIPNLQDDSDFNGMTLRDYFAAKAMQGMFAAFKHWPRDYEHGEVGKHAYQAADAMLAARGEQ
ncbi:hypothetical protein [Achromobacter xylosoxidans]